MINNFLEMGVKDENIHIVCWKVNGIIPEEWKKLQKCYKVQFFFYDDLRTTRYYISSIRPNILKQHFIAHPYLRDEAIFYHDCDIIFRTPISKWIKEEMLIDDKWYGSDTKGYIAYNYIIQKGEKVLNDMCGIVGISPELVKQNNDNSIGAQYLMKNIDSSFWDRIEKNSEILFKVINERLPEYTEIWKQKMLDENKGYLKDNKLYAVADIDARNEWKYHEVQIWCADMWSLLWEAWLMGKETVCDPGFTFSWGSDSEETYLKNNIMHNAGVTTSETGLFYKASYMSKIPYYENLNINKGTASWYYWKAVQKTGEKSCLK